MLRLAAAGRAAGGDPGVSIGITRHARRDHGMNSNANVSTLVWTFGLMSLFAVGGANAAVPEMHRIAVDVQHWMTDRQFADIYAISQLSPGPNVLIVTLIGYTSPAYRRAGRDACDVRPDRGACLLREPVCCRRSSQSRWPSIIQAALVPLSIGLMARQRPDRGAGRRPELGGRAVDPRGSRSGLRDAAQSALAVAGRGRFGFRWCYLRKAARQSSGRGDKTINPSRTGSKARFRGRR